MYDFPGKNSPENVAVAVLIARLWHPLNLASCNCNNMRRKLQGIMPGAFSWAPCEIFLCSDGLL